MTIKPKLTLIGDAWIYGTMRMDADFLVPDQPGMSTMLSDQFDVAVEWRDTNWGVWLTPQTIKEKIVDSTVIVFQGDLSLRYPAYEHDVNYTDMARDSSDLRDFFCRAANAYYSVLDDIAAAADSKIYMIGAATDIEPTLLARYPNLVNLCTSWIQLVYPDHEPTPVMCGYIRAQQFDLEREFERLGRDDLLGQLLITNNPFKAHELRKTGMFTNFNSEPKIFPTLQAHSIIAQHILENIPK